MNMFYCLVLINIAILHEERDEILKGIKIWQEVKTDIDI